tara:strand:- start:63977 stop:64588 length:612 start_codon:yes stop_codon:yes gene_type:complete
MVLITIPYFSLETDVAFLRIKQWVFRLFPTSVSNIWITAFYIHVFTSVFALIAGFTQFNKRFLWKKTHRIMGAIYIVTVLLLTGPSGLIMGFFANGGPLSVVAFSTLVLLWWWFTFKAYTAIRNRDYEAHSKFMYRSFALTLSAVTLRLWKYVIVNYLYEMPPMDLYRLVAWLGWVPNLILAEILIYKGFHLKLLTKKLNHPY